jgi:hypothetical protein
MKLQYDNTDDDDVYLEYYIGIGFQINYSCLHVLRKHINSSNKAQVMYNI